MTARERLAAVDAALDALAWDLAFTSAGGIVVEIRDRLDRIGRIVYDLEPWDNNVDDRGAPARRLPRGPDRLGVTTAGADD